MSPGRLADGPRDAGTGRVLPLVGVGAVIVVGLVVMWVFSNGAAVDVGSGLVWLLVPVLLVAGFWYDARRRRLTKEWAARVGWHYVGSDSSLTRRWRGSPFDVGSSRRTHEVVVGTWAGRQCTSFRYQYTTGSGKNRTTHTYHVVAMSLPTYLPTLELTPEGVGARIAKAFGGQDIEFESADFNRAWRVEARDARFAHDVVHPRLMERLLQPDARGLALRVEGTDVLSWSSGFPDLDAMPRRLGVMSALVDAIPRFVWLDHGHDPATT